MHAVLTMTLIHDRYLSAAPNSKMSTTEAFHWYKSIALFNSKLSGPVQHSERDALWAATIFVGMIAFHFVEAKTPEEAWPLKPPSSMDLNWLKISDGKKCTWKIAQPMRDDSVWQPLVLHNMNMRLLPSRSAIPGLEALPVEIIKLCALDAMSNTNNSPFYSAASSLARSLNSECMMSTFLNFLFFIGDMPPDYTKLLERKDPRALLLLAYWYAKVCQYQIWWIRPLVTIECQAICMYLERHYAHQIDVQALLQYPKLMSGIIAS